MYRKYYLVEVVLLLLLSHGGWNGPSVTLLSCTSESSKLVKDVVQKRFLSIVEKYRVSVPMDCPLHPRRDMFSWLQTELEATKMEGQEAWHCPVCGQKFRCENTFVTHWDASHSKTLGLAEDKVCLDEYCDVFRCDVLRKKMEVQRLEEEDHQRKTDRQQYITLLKHKNTEGANEENKEEKKKCDPKALRQVHRKCRALVRQCTVGMLANLSSKDFQDIEDDLDLSICSFLTCDKYWDDFDSHIHQVPVLVIAIAVILSVTLFCLCYYGLWILLERQSPSQVCYNCQKTSMAEMRYRNKLQKQQRCKQNSPEFHTSRQNSPEFPSRRHTPEYSSRKNSPEYPYRQSSPEFRYRPNSENYHRKTSPEVYYRHDSPEAKYTKNNFELQVTNRVPSRCS